MELYGNQARNVGIALAPAIGFYGGLGNLLATALMGDRPLADDITLAYALSSWKPTTGTRLTIKAAEQRRSGRRLVYSSRGLELRSDEACITEWVFPAPFGRQVVTAEFTTADSAVVEGESLAEGSTVTVVLRDNEEAFELTPGGEDELLDSIAQIERGEFVSGEQLLERLRRFG